MTFGEVVYTEPAQRLVPRAIERLPVGAVAWVGVRVIAAIPCGVEDSRKRRPHVRSLSVVDRIDDEVDSPLPSHRTTDTAVDEVLVECDQVDGPGLDDYFVTRFAAM
jgi:hypothetical protein